MDMFMQGAAQGAQSGGGMDFTQLINNPGQEVDPMQQYGEDRKRVKTSKEKWGDFANFLGKNVTTSSSYQNYPKFG